ncbi:MAG: hypothetical protein HXX13_02200 [Bacteroidetes bacterium]|nr:hypothetical protein [Bacteroidota bacterium]
MKRFSKIYYSISLLLIFNVLLNVNALYAQVPPPPPPPNGGPNQGHGMGGNQGPAGPNAPIENGQGVLLLLGMIYVGKKVFDYRKKLESSK